MTLTVLTFINGGFFLITEWNLFWKVSAIGAEGARSSRDRDKDCKTLVRAVTSLLQPALRQGDGTNVLPN